MNKRVVLLLCTILVAMMLFGACASSDTTDEASPDTVDETSSDTTDEATPGPVVDNDENIVVIEVNGEAIYYDEYYALYASYCSSYGVEEDDETSAPFIQEEVIAQLVSKLVLKQKLEELGYMDLSDEKLEEAQTQAQDTIDYYIEYSYGTQIAETLGDDYTDAEYAAALAEYEQTLLDSIGVTKEEIVKDYVINVAAEVANEDITKDVEPTEEEIKTQYDEYVASDTEQLDADPTLYVSYYLGDSPVYYTPSGVRQVLQVLVMMDEDTQSAIGLLRSEGYDEQADLLRTDALANIEEEAQALLEQLESGELAFEDAALDEEYNDDTGTTAEGYPVLEGATEYVEEFTEASMALENIGDISGLVATDFGYHILKYIAETPEGAVDYDSVHDDIAEMLKASRQAEVWSAQLEAWEAEAEVEYYNDNM